ncbi:MAG: hypothetical protein CM15mP74_30580 [Halieaceae bacterium]|nr:MAG: hypothetical protein CM15mP74_30580 [Halieaceae bacterium]
MTAERREASVQDVPIAVSAYSEEMLDRLQIDDTLDLINVVPNLFGVTIRVWALPTCTT